MNSTINEQLTGLAHDVAKLMPDPANARKHGERNLDAIKASLTLFGQRKPIVATRAGVVVAGNGTLLAAKALGWKQIAVVFVDDDASMAAAYGIADNRTAELAEWDDDVLGTILGGLANTAINMESMGFSDQELRNIIGGAEDVPAAAQEESAGGGDVTLKITLPKRESEEVSAWLDSITPHDPSAALLKACRRANR